MRDFLWLCCGDHPALSNTLTWTTHPLWSYPNTVGDNTITLIDFQVWVTVWSSRLGRRPMRSRSPIHYRLLRHRRRRCLQGGWVRISRRATSYGFFSSRLRQSKSLCSAVVTVFQRKGELNYRKRQQNSVDLNQRTKELPQSSFRNWMAAGTTIDQYGAFNFIFLSQERRQARPTAHHFVGILITAFFCFCFVWTPMGFFFFLPRKTSHRFFRVLFVIL